MYLSRLIPNPRCRDVRRDVADCQHLHRTVMSAFPQGPPDAGGARSGYGVLHRLEWSPRSGELVLYVQSQVQPDWSRLPPGYLMPSGDGQDNPACKPLDELYARIRPGLTLVFRLRVNPTRKVDTKTGADGVRRNGRRVALRSEQEQVDWLRRKALESGFALVDVRRAPGVPDLRVAVGSAAWEGMSRVTGSHPAGGLTLDAVVFEGRLRVTDATRFREALAKGIGSGKAYGCGLMSVAPTTG